MEFSLRDGIASTLVGAILLTYALFLMKGGLPLIHEARWMAGAGLVVAATAAAFLGRPAFGGTARGRAAGAGAAVTVVIGGAATTVREDGTLAHVLLAVFIGLLSITWLLAITADSEAQAPASRTAHH